MRLTRISLENFKCFQQVNIDCSTFTLLTGGNSSGKSSLLMSVLGALQTKNYPFYFSPNGPMVNMGDFRELAYAHDASARVRINLTFASEKERLTRLNSCFCVDSETGLPKLECLEYRSNDLHFDVERKNGHYDASFRYDPAKDPMKKVQESSGFLSFLDSLDHFITDKEKTGTRKPSRSQSTIEISPTRFKEAFFPTKKEGNYSFKNPKELFEAGGNAFLVRRMGEMCGHTNDFNRHSNYISSFRLPPERTYYRRTKAAMKIDKFGENWIDQLVEWEQAKAEEFQTLQRICRAIGLASSINSKHYGGGRFEIRV